MLEANIKIIRELKQFIALIATNPELLSKFSCSDKHFTRARKLPFEKLVLFILKLNKKTLSVELEQFFKDLSHPIDCSVSAFTQQRLKLAPVFFYYWNLVLLSSFYHYYADKVRKWKGYRIIAADGSNVSLINNIGLNNHFGGQRNGEGSFVAAKTFYHYDVLNELVLFSKIAPYREGEFAIACDAINTLDEDTVTIYDRYYSNYNTVALHMWQEQERKFVIRGNEQQNLIKTFIKSGVKSTIATMIPSPAAIIALKKRGFIVTKNTLLKVRLVRVELSQSVEVLITNLWEEDGFEATLFKDLYFLRWGIETNISIQKNILQLESFSGLTVLSVQQDFYATVLMVNLHSLLIKHAQQTVNNTMHNRKYPMKINKNKSIAKLKANLIDLFICNEAEALLQKLHAYFIRDILPVRKGRSFKRIRKNKQSNSKYKTFSNFKPSY